MLSSCSPHSRAGDARSGPRRDRNISSRRRERDHGVREWPASISAELQATFIPDTSVQDEERLAISKDSPPRANFEATWHLLHGEWFLHQPHATSLMQL